MPGLRVPGQTLSENRRYVPSRHLPAQHVSVEADGHSVNKSREVVSNNLISETTRQEVVRKNAEAC